MDLASGSITKVRWKRFSWRCTWCAITLDELRGFRDAMLELCIPVKFEEPVMDVCVQVVIARNTFNISAVFFVVACGQPVAKAELVVSSVSGSSNVLEYFGYSSRMMLFLPQIIESCEHILRMHCLCSPTMKTAAPIRKGTVLRHFQYTRQMMVNPALPPRQLVGVFNLELARLYGYLYQSWIETLWFYDLQGYDEISLTGGFKIFTNAGERVYEPADLGLRH